ncbi:hypothetical protein [Myroides sp. DF42-4-2]|uniref:hypothetical protein n=1 Tax=unclassified Myroides TaxID=2642485 RepID=UPI002578B411|nr:hypothetical protein [Myroides sp. DF42-4-2]MDM1408050.1 hypothetical protein [Myroides sp. DF42-4-2]
MKYVLMQEATAIEKGVIPTGHYYPQKDGDVIFKKDILTIFGQQGNQVDFEYEELETREAIERIESWN